ncbi:general stress protein [Fimbriiglobus ruber]|uniref:Uncharacterized protein n=1 Tax=Fimbriiglobus ruber TaxID=1908690 RepID=A0A225DTN8_9BACT|nr:general stress protein [Fimbriiglobus ruber]OWK39745.1 hypothetical protein FRUB_05635 [Fimbriiglobus ruber]
MMTHETVVGAFDNRERAREAIQGLKSAGFSDDQLGILTQDQSTRVVGERAAAADETPSSHWEEGTGIGAAAGAATGLGIGLAVAAGLVPPLGPIIAGGTLIALLASAGAGATVGSVVGGLIGLGVPEDEASYYEEEFRSGRTLVTVRTENRAEEARSILNQHGAVQRETVDTY